MIRIKNLLGAICLLSVGFTIYTLLGAFLPSEFSNPVFKGFVAFLLVYLLMETTRNRL